ncbi:MAG: cytochrome c biogenesis protein CcsA [Verrucomicrobiota bacterium]
MTERKPPSKAGRWIAASLASLAIAGLFLQLVRDNTPKGEARKVDGYSPWSEKAINDASLLPVQDGGRVKPFSTYAGFTMLRLHGARSMKITDAKGEDVKLTPTAWMLDSLFRPELAIQLPTFRIDNSAVLEAIGVKALGRRDRYSYTDLRDGRAKLAELAAGYSKTEAKQRDPLQNQIVDLNDNVGFYEILLGYFTFARNGVTLHGSAIDGGPDKRASVSSIMATAPMIRSQLAQSRQGGEPDARLRGMLDQVLEMVNYARTGFAIFPPVEKDASLQWRQAGNVIMETMNGSGKHPDVAIEDITALEKLARSAPDGGSAWDEAMAGVSTRFVGRATARDEYRHVELEVRYYITNGFLRAWIFFILGSITALCMWAFGKHKAAKVFLWATLACCIAGLYYCISAIVTRCIIMERPPVGNLYDTIIFICTTVVCIALVIELLVRRRFALGLAPVLGATLIWLARRYEVGDAKDHMDPLVAVLLSNFWLTYHVLTITLGYSAGLLSAFLSTGYIFMRGFGLDGGDLQLRRSLTRAAYGTLCLTLFLSLVGTVLGGVWANYSWGRFWGWDPKENGALLIVLWTLAVLHARMGGYIREWGLHLCAVFTAVIVTFSWWHVNFLGVGLHNYGFTAGKNSIWAFYAVMTLVMAFGLVTMLRGKSAVSERDEPFDEPLKL